MRADPIVVARQARAHLERERDPAAATSHAKRDSGMGPALREVLARPDARLGVSAMAIGHLVMIAVMAMTPVHIRSAGHDPAHTLRIVGIIISLHIAGMYAFAPLIGWVTDRLGRLPVIAAGVALLLTACALAGTAGHGSAQLAAALVVLGLGWSSTMVAGSTMLTDSVVEEMRASAQGLSDVIMGFAGATAGALSGVIMSVWGYPALVLLAASTTLVLIGQTLHFRRGTRVPIAAAGTV
jgi:MFS family permease